MTTDPDAPAASPKEIKHANVSAVIERLRKLLSRALDSPPFWVKGELSGVGIKNGHLYSDLVETRDGKVTAKIRCTIWSRDMDRIREGLGKDLTDEVLRSGVEVGLRCKVSFHDVFGLQLHAREVDPAVTLGALEARRERIIETLRGEGLLERNRQLPPPFVPQRVGLIASKDTAGLEDFLQTIRASGHGVRVYHADASVQGQHAEGSILIALDALESLHRRPGSRLDLVVIIRGGGSKVDLAHLDSELVARRIAGLALPVWCGIGHETDLSVLDLVAGRSFKTPTALAEEIVGRHAAERSRVQDATNRLRTIFRLALGPEKERLASAKRRMVTAARNQLTGEQRRLRSTAAGIRRGAAGWLTTRRAQLTVVRGKLVSLPRSILTLTRGAFEVSRKSLFKTADRRLQTEQLLGSHRRGRMNLAARLRRLDGERRHLRRLGASIAGAGRSAVSAPRAVLDANARSLHKTVHRRLRAADDTRQRLAAALTSPARLHLLAAERSRLAERLARVRAMDPRNVLRRGYAVVYRQDGTLVRSINELDPGAETHTHLADGQVRSIVQATTSDVPERESQENPDDRDQ